MSVALGKPAALSPTPILEAVERYRGVIVDLDLKRAILPDEFARAREGLADSLARRGLASGDRVMLAVSNGPLFIASLAAILACDASPLLVHAKTPPAELVRYAQRFGVKFLASDPPDEQGMPDGIRQCGQVALGDIAALEWGAFDDPESVPGPVLRGVPLHPTSGSTGLPKIALRPGHAAMEEARHYAMTMDVQGDDYIAALPPMSHAYGYGVCVMLPLLTGANIVSMHRFSVKLLQKAIEEYPLTILPTVPAMLDVLSFGGGADLRSLRWVLTAGSILPRRSAERFLAKTGLTPCPLYGTTETGGISVSTTGDGRDIDGRVGPPMRGVCVEVRPHESGSALGPSVGKLFVRSSSLMSGYLDDEGEITKPPADGYFETGDLARMDHDGAIHLRGRDSEVINVLGLKVVPCEVEEAIACMKGVVEVKVYAGERRAANQIVKVAVAVENGLSMADIRDHCEQNLVYYKRPQVITLVGALPRTPTGKIIPEQLP